MYRVTVGSNGRNEALKVGEDAHYIDLRMGCDHCDKGSEKIIEAELFSGTRLIERSNLCPSCRNNIEAGKYQHPLTDAYTVRYKEWRRHVRVNNHDR